MPTKIDIKLTYVSNINNDKYKITDINKELDVVWMKAVGYGISVPYRYHHFHETFIVSLKDVLNKL